MSSAFLDVKAAPLSVRDMLAQGAAAVDAELERRLAWHGTPDPGRLREAMHYAVVSGGKRLRPCFTVAVATAVGGAAVGAAPGAALVTSPRVLCAAAAVEMLHAYTLVHDDLPAMDDDDERRGRPTVHIAFGEAIAILAGDGLLTLAMQTLAELGVDAGRAIKVLGERSGAAQLLGGQAIDLSADKAAMSFDVITELHSKKTGALFAAACELGAIAAGASDQLAADFGDYGMKIGIAFQHADDIDDAEFVEHRAAATAARQTLCREAASILAKHRVDSLMLSELAAWIGRQA